MIHEGGMLRRFMRGNGRGEDLQSLLTIQRLAITYSDINEYTQNAQLKQSIKIYWSHLGSSHSDLEKTDYRYRPLGGRLVL